MYFMPLKNDFNAKDSGLIFSIALLTINIIGVAVVVFLKDIAYIFSDAAYFYVSIAITQLTILFTCIIYCNHNNIAFFKALRLDGNFNKKHTAAAIFTGLTMMFVLVVPALYFIEFLESLGYVSSDVGIEINSFSTFITATIFIAAFPAVCEEILFRGIILQGLRRFGDVFAIIVSAFLFMLFHTNPSQTLYPLLSGMVMGFVFIKTGNLKYTMIIHFLNNFLSIATEYLSNVFGYQDIESSLTFTTTDIITIGVSAIIFGLCMFYFSKQKNMDYTNIKLKVYKLKYLFYDGTSFLRAYERYIYFKNINALKANAVETFSFLQGQDSQEDNDRATALLNNSVYSEAENLFKQGYIFNPRKNTFQTNNPTVEQMPLSDAFIDASNNPIYNPFASTKKSFLKYSLFGLIASIVLWFVVFFG